jgi:hypothetical protein
LPTGEPYHQIAKKDGTGTRPVTLADARKVLALPSVTNVLAVLAKPGLDAWKIEQGIMAALTLPRVADEPLDMFARRVVTDMGEQVERAADFGTSIHAAHGRSSCRLIPLCLISSHRGKSGLTKTLSAWSALKMCLSASVTVMRGVWI